MANTVFSDPFYSTFPYSAGQDYVTYDVETAPSMPNMQGDRALTFDFLTVENQADHGPQGHTWHGSHNPLTGSSSHTVPDVFYTYGGMPSPQRFETHFVSSPHPSVSHPGYWPVNESYQHSVPVRPSTERNSSFHMSTHPVVSHTPMVHHAVLDTHRTFASTTLPPHSESSSAPVVSDMPLGPAYVGAVNSTIDSIHPRPSAMPEFAHVLDTPGPGLAPSLPPKSAPDIQSSPVVHCMVDDCDEEIAVDKVALRQHLNTAHGYPAPHRSHSVVCRWSGCICTRPSTCRTLNLPSGHGMHIEDITEHIWSAHLNFQDVCGKCGDARWAHGFSFQRHVNGCGGRKPARCMGCRQIFRSTVALAGHVELGQCVGIVHGWR